MRRLTPSSVLLILSVAYAVAMFHRTSFSGLAPLLSADKDLTLNGLAWASSSFFWAYLCAQIPAGIMIDAVGPKRVAVLGMLVMTLGTALFASATSSLFLGLGRALCAVGAVSVFLAMIDYCGRHFGNHSSSMLGRSLLIGNLGGILSGAPLALLLQYFPWRSAWSMLGIMTLLMSAIVIFLPTHVNGRPPVAKSWQPAMRAFGASLLHSNVYLGAGALAGLAGALHAFTGFGAYQFAKTLQLNARDIGVGISVMILGFAIGTWLWGTLGDQRKLRNQILVYAPVGATCVWFALAHSPPLALLPLSILLILGGICCAAFGSIYGVLDELTDPRARGAVKAAANCGIALGAAVVQVVQGHTTADQSVWPCVILSVIGMACSWTLVSRCRQLPLLGNGLSVQN